MNFTEILKHWYSVNKREMPWRLTKDPYKIWLSEIILQQTQIKQGLPYYEIFVNKFPTIQDLASASEETVLKAWQGLGYYSRARNLHATAKYISQERDGVFPDHYKALLQLKGVGDYTASAIASICFNEPTAVVDGNVYRVLSRFYGIHTPINSTKGIKEFKIIAQKLIDTNNPGDYNQAIMEFGAVQCKPKSPNCLICPLQSKCHAYNKSMIAQLPVKLKTLKVKKRYFNYVVFISEDKKTLLKQREGKGIWMNLYEFPLIETDKTLTRNELLAHSGFKSLVPENNAEVALYNSKDVIHKLSHQHLYTKFWIVHVKALKQEGISIEAMRTYPVPILIHNFIESYSF